MQLRSFVFLALFAVWSGLAAREFTVVVYNVENLFDIDGVALYGDYEQGRPGGYSAGHLLNKLEGIRLTLAAYNDGAGPEVILFQEFELDRTPYGAPDAGAFLRSTRGRPLGELLEQERWSRDLPAELLLLKHLDDHGMGGYRVARPDPARMETHTPHHNVVFSRFPVTGVRQRALHQARDMVEVRLDVDGHELILLNNHWKSGASDPATEPIRVQNARVVRAHVEALLLENPRADVLIAGDLNSYYNQRAIFPELAETAVNDVLGAHGFEARLREGGPGNFYNLWFELPLEERGSEVWRGRWGTLMQMILTPGLHDRRGIQYVDNSFGRLALPGLNVDRRWGRPIAWSNYGGGGGFSDHLPIHARFRAIAGPGEDGWMELENPTSEALSDHRPVVPFRRMDRRAVPPATQLAAMTPAERVRQIGELFTVNAALVSARPARIRVGDLELEVFSPVRSVRERLDQLQPGDPLQAFADLGDWRGRLQLVIQDEGWLIQPSPQN